MNKRERKRIEEWIDTAREVLTFHRGNLRELKKRPHCKHEERQIQCSINHTHGVIVQLSSLLGVDVLLPERKDLWKD